MRSALKLSLTMLPGVFLWAACVPLPSRTSTIVISERVVGGGLPTERLQQEMVSQRTYYLIAPDGPVLKNWPCRFNYVLANTNGSRQYLTFLNKKHAQWDYLVGFPISGERWIAITIPESGRRGWPTPNDLEVFVFHKETILYSQTIASAFDSNNLKEPFPGSPAWKPLIGGLGYRTRNFSFDPKSECVTFTKPSGDTLFNPNNGTLRKISSD